MVDKIAVYLSEDEQKLFIEFQKRFAMFKILEGATEAFTLKNGSIEIHFDTNGDIAKVDLHKHFRPSLR